MSAKRTMRFTAQGFRSQEIEIAPDADDPRSKRYDIIAEEVSIDKVIRPDYSWSITNYSILVFTN